MATIPRSFFYAFLLLLFFAPLRANELPFIKVKSEKAWENIFQQAKKERKLVFAGVYTKWCSFCKKLDKEVYTNGPLIDFFSENFINIKFDAESKFGLMLAKKLTIDSYPTLLFLSPDIEIIERIEGFYTSPSPVKLWPSGSGKLVFPSPIIIKL